eukprot:280743_1
MDAQKFKCIDNKTTDLINGYIRQIQKLSNCHIPMDINKLCAIFYFWQSVFNFDPLGRMHRIYFSSPKLNCIKQSVHILIPNVSTTLYEMCRVNKHNNNLLFVDICVVSDIKFNPSNKLHLTFHHQNNIIAANIDKTYRAIYHCETTGTNKQFQTKPDIDIIMHLCKDAIDCTSYLYARVVIKSLKWANTLNISTEENQKVWDQQLELVTNAPNIVNVHKLQVLKAFNPTDLEPLTPQQLFYITRAFLQEDSPIFKHKDNEQKTAIQTYNSFVADSRKFLNYAPERIKCLHDRLFLIPIFNYFEYFRVLKETTQNKQRKKIWLKDVELKKINYNKYNELTCDNMIFILDIDLRIARFQNNRIWRMETIILNFCKKMKNNGDYTLCSEIIINMFSFINKQPNYESIMISIF